jgi:hypothetical protein
LLITESPIKAFRYILHDECQPELLIRIIHRDVVMATMGAVEMSNVYVYPEIHNNGYTILKETKLRGK